MNPGPQTRRCIANLDSTAIDEDCRQLVLGVDPFRVAAMVCEVVDRGVALNDQFVAYFFHDTTEIARRHTLTAPCFGNDRRLRERLGAGRRFREFVLEVRAIFPFT